MIALFKKFFNTKEKKVLLENFFSLSFLQVANYVLPMLTLPYLVRILGPEKYGLIAFAQAFVGYFNILTTYGFNLSATREISINRYNKEKVSEIFSSVITVKMILMLLSFFILLVFIVFVPKFKNNRLIYLFSFGLVIGQALFPVWFFQGMEKMKYITFLNITAKLIFTIAVFIFIRKKEHYLFVPILISLGFIIAGILGLIIVYKDFGISFSKPNYKQIWHQLKKGWHIFISTVSISLYTTSNTVILGLFSNNITVGYYAAAEKIIRMVQMLFYPVSQSVYPYINKLANVSKERALRFIGNLTKVIGIVSFCISSLIFIFAGLIIDFILGEQYHQSIIVLRILAFLPFVICLSNIFGIQTMLTFNYKKQFSKILIIAGIINIILALIITPMLKHIGISISVLITETFVMIVMLLFLKSKRLISFKCLLNCG